MSTQLLIRIDGELKNRFDKIARIEGKTKSEKVRELVKEYVEERDIGKYIDNLWNRIGKKIQKKYSLSDVPSVIEKVREEKRGKF